MTTVLTVINAVVAIAVCCLVYTMLPVAHSVDCEGRRTIGEVCQPLGSFVLLAASVLPAVVLGTLVFIAHRIRELRANAALLCLLAGPVAVGLLGFNAWINSL